MNDTLTKPEAELHTGHKPGRVAHIIDQRPGSGQDVTTAYIEGTELVALCGHAWVPSRDPVAVPICPACKSAWYALHGGGELS